MKDSQTNYECCLLTIDYNTFVLLKMLDNSFKIFDSHSRDYLYEMPRVSGTVP